MNGDRELRVALTDVPGLDRLNPYQSNTLHIHTVMWPIYEPLFDIGDREPILCLADRIDEDGLTYTFKLRTDVRFHRSGDKPAETFTASSVANNLRRVITTEPASFRERILHGLIAGVDDPGDDLTVRIRLKYRKPELLFLALMTGPHADERRPPLGTGPFYLDPANQRDSEIVLTRHPEYRARVGQLARIIFRPIDPTQITSELTNGNVDFVRDVDPDSIQEVLRNPQLQIRTVHPHGLHYLGFNLSSKAFSSRETRRAFRDVIDYSNIESETGLEPARGPIPPHVEAYDPALQTPHQTRAEARSVLAKDCRESFVTLLFNKNSYYGRELAHCIARDLVAAHVAVKLEPKERSSDLLQEITRRGRTQDDNYAFIYNWYSILPAAEIFLRPLFEDGMPDNLTKYKGAQDLLKATWEPDPEGRVSVDERIKRYRKAQQQIVDDVPMVFLGHSRIRYSAYRRGVIGLGSLNVQSFPVDRYLGVDVR
jgi:peptide/nickel transport system substrate-binding protein